MEQTQVVAFDAMAQDTCAQPAGMAFAGMGAIALQPNFHPVTRRDLMAAVNIVARDLGLRAPSVMVLDALLSCLPCRDAATGGEKPVTPATLLTIFAANDTLCFRAKGITDRQLRRHIERLEEVGLVRRRDSANGKRFPVKSGGKIVGAFGIDLSPLLEQSAALIERAQQRRAELDELRGLKARVQGLRAECLQFDLAPEAKEFLDGLRNLMRRAGTTIVQVRAAIARLTEILTTCLAIPSQAPCPEDTHPEIPPVHDVAPMQCEPAIPDEQSGTDGQNVRHKEPENPDTKKPVVSLHRLWMQLETLGLFFPEVPRSTRDLHTIIHDAGKMLRIRPETLANAIARIGCEQTLRVQDRIAGNESRIAAPDLYMRRIVEAAPNTGPFRIRHVRAGLPADD